MDAAFAELPLAEGGRALVDEFSGGAKQGIEAVLDSSVGNGYGQMRLAATGLAMQYQASTLGDEVRQDHFWDSDDPAPIFFN